MLEVAVICQLWPPTCTDVEQCSKFVEPTAHSTYVSVHASKSEALPATSMSHTGCCCCCCVRQRADCVVSPGAFESVPNLHAASPSMLCLPAACESWCSCVGSDDVYACVRILYCRHAAARCGATTASFCSDRCGCVFTEKRGGGTCTHTDCGWGCEQPLQRLMEHNHKQGQPGVTRHTSCPWSVAAAKLLAHTQCLMCCDSTEYSTHSLLTLPHQHCVCKIFTH